LDTHTLIWSVDSPAKLGSRAKATLTDPANDLLLSAGSLWEIAIKIGLGKLTLSMPFRQWTTQAMSDLDLTLLPLNVDYTDVLIGLTHHHRDPFDRLIIAQAMVEQIPVVSADSAFDAYQVARIW
jgi:PIN domain nuclease of toxin-antitoxin system